MMKLLTTVHYAILSGVALFKAGTSRDIGNINTTQILPRQNTLSPFYPRNLEDLTLVRAAFDELGYQIGAKLNNIKLGCISMATDKLEGSGSVCPARDKIMVDLIQESFRQLSIRYPQLRSGITATPPNGVSPVSWDAFNDNYFKLNNALSFALKEIRKQACFILADTNSKTYDAVYGGTMTPAAVQGIELTVTSILDSWVDLDRILEGGIAPRAFDGRAQDLTEDGFQKIFRTKALFTMLGAINDLQSVTTGAQECVSLLAELTASLLIGGIGGALTGG
ncbi:hypothetical protein TWF730_000043 [Orbilia blumenaviensis]|uniref:Uncharacterized protein n=1 Tax=Orbilia blumenaviensis TaxID=1796055 RepID=A0AAV9VLR0_9PEZI